MSIIASPLNPTEGHILAGVQIDEHRFLARVKAPQLFQIAPDPRDSEDKRKLAASKEAQDMRSVRESVQRLFEGAKAKNVGPYAEYIVGIHEGHAGITPAIILYCEDRLDLALEGQFGHGTVLVPWGKKLVAIDGETQLAARYEAANRNPETLSDYIAVTSAMAYRGVGRARRSTTSMYWPFAPTRQSAWAWTPEIRSRPHPRGRGPRPVLLRQGEQDPQAAPRHRHGRDDNLCAARSVRHGGGGYRRREIRQQAGTHR